MSLRVLHVITRLTLGGSPENTLASIVGLTQAGYDCALAVSFRESEGHVLDDAHRRRVRLLDVPTLGREVALLSDMAALRQLLRAPAHERPRRDRSWRGREARSRFALKCLPLATASRLMVHLAARAATHAARRNVKIALAIALAFARNAALLSGTWAARRAVRRSEVLTHETLMRRFAPREGGA